MEQRKYRANTLREAKLKMLLDVGKRGYIVNQRSIRTGGLFGLFGKPMVEITVNVLTSSDMNNDSSTNVDYMDNDLGFGVIKNNGNDFGKNYNYSNRNTLVSSLKSSSNGTIMTKESNNNKKGRANNDISTYRDSLERIKEIGLNLSKLEKKSSENLDNKSDQTEEMDNGKNSYGEDTQIREELAKLKSMLLEIKGDGKYSEAESANTSFVKNKMSSDMVGDKKSSTVYYDSLINILTDYDFTENIIMNYIKLNNYLTDDMKAKLYDKETKTVNREMFIEFVISDLLNDAGVVNLSEGICIDNADSDNNNSDKGKGKKTTDNKVKAIALVGPTGVGKTTTLAKLGAYYGIIQGKKVKFISMDNYRVGAVQQLKIYSEIMEIPFAKVTSIDELRSEIDYDLYDLILVDTAGRSQKTDDEITEIKEYLDIFNDVNVSLVVSSTTKYKDLLEIFDKFSILRYNNIIATKLDETNSFGQILSALIEKELTLSYISFGQSVPEDLKSASKINLLETLFNY